MSLSPAAFARRLGGAATERQVRNFCKAGMTGTMRIGSRWKIDPGPACEWVEQNAPRCGMKLPMRRLEAPHATASPAQQTAATKDGARAPATATPASVKALVVLMTSVADQLAAGDLNERIIDALADLAAATAAGCTDEQAVDAALEAMIESGEAVEPANGVGIGFADRESARRFFLQAAGDLRLRLAHAIAAGIRLPADLPAAGELHERADLPGDDQQHPQR